MTISAPPLDAAPPPPPAAPARRGLLAVAAGIIAWPRSTFAYLRDHGGRSWLLPLALALALTVAARVVAQPIERAQAEALRAQLEAQLEALQDSAGAGDGGAVFTTGTVGGPVTLGSGPVAPNPVAEFGLPLLGVLGDWALRGGGLLALAWVLGGRPAAGAMFRMSGWTLLPDILRLLVALGVMVSVGRVPVRGLSGFSPGGGETAINVSPVEGGGGVATEDGGTLEPSDGNNVMVIGPGGATTGTPNSAPPFLLFLQTSFLGSVDVYLLWALGLLLIGVAVTARLGWLKAGLATLLYFGLSVALGALPPLLSFYLLRLTGPTMLGP